MECTVLLHGLCVKYLEAAHGEGSTGEDLEEQSLTRTLPPPIRQETQWLTGGKQLQMQE